MGYIMWAFLVLLPINGGESNYAVMIAVPDKVVCETIREGLVKDGNVVQTAQCNSIRISN